VLVPNPDGHLHAGMPITHGRAAAGERDRNTVTAFVDDTM